MKSMIIAFVLNLLFAVFEFFGGMMTNSVSIMSDAIHDLGDAISIGFAVFLENKSEKKADEKFTFGYARYSVLSAVITSSILLIGATIIAINATYRLFNPQPLNYNGILIFAIIGFIINLIATIATREGDSLNKKAVNMHMLEDVLGWAIVLIGAVVMKFTNFSLLDTALSLVVSLFIFMHAVPVFISAVSLFLEKAPKGVKVKKIEEDIKEVKGVKEVHRLKVWSLDEHNVYAMVHVVAEDNFKDKAKIREILHKAGVTNTTIEIEAIGEECTEEEHHFHKNGGHTHHHHNH